MVVVEPDGTDVVPGGAVEPVLATVLVGDVVGAVATGALVAGAAVGAVVGGTVVDGAVVAVGSSGDVHPAGGADEPD